nr:MAG TPA: hypothetical protein [Caudoviricetes sp.]
MFSFSKKISLQSMQMYVCLHTNTSVLVVLDFLYMDR